MRCPSIAIEATRAALDTVLSLSKGGCYTPAVVAWLDKLTMAGQRSTTLAPVAPFARER